MKHSNLTLLLTVLMSIVGAKTFAHDIEVKNADGITIYYNYINEGAELEVTSPSSYWNEYRDNVVIPEEVTYMSITRKVTSIGDQAFYGCSYLTSVIIPNSVTSIGNHAFNGCSDLTSVTIGNGVTSIGHYAFTYCYHLKKVIVKDIAAWCGIKFGVGSNPLSSANHLYSDDDTEITNLVIPNSVTSIGDYAFQGCEGLTSVNIPNSVTSIGNYAFSSCSGLISVTLDCKEIKDWFKYMTSIKEINIGNNVTSIGNDAFMGCSGLTSVTIPNSVTSIGSEAFNCENLTTVVSLIENPFKIYGISTTNRVFSQNTFKKATLYVPTGKKEAYEATEGWRDFRNIVEGTPTGVTNITLDKETTNAPVYDLNGRRLTEPQKGINIIGGKKVVVK